MIKKVYCKNCKYYYYQSCHHPSEIDRNPYNGRVENAKHILKSENKNGECKYYEPSLKYRIKLFFKKLGVIIGKPIKLLRKKINLLRNK